MSVATAVHSGPGLVQNWLQILSHRESSFRPEPVHPATMSGLALSAIPDVSAGQWRELQQP